MIQSGDQFDEMNRTSTKYNDHVIESKGRDLPFVCLWCCEVSKAMCECLFVMWGTFMSRCSFPTRNRCCDKMSIIMKFMHLYMTLRLPTVET